MKSLKTDTIAHQLGVRPYTNSVSHTAVPVQVIAAGVKNALEGKAYPTCGKVPTKRTSNPEVDALLFYFLNHAIAVATKKMHPLESLGRYLPLYEEYNLMLAEQTRRMFYYLVAICTRESRHNKAGSSSSSWTAMQQKYGNAAYDFHFSIKGKGSEQAVEIFCETPPIMSLGRYTEYLCDSFYKGDYSSSFGGKAWGGIADVLRKFVHGEYTAEMMLDTAFTLCHNNGPIFNKGMFYDSYTHEIYKILDVQRSGQIPRLIKEVGVSNAHNARVQTMYSKVVKIMGEEDLLGDKDYVDWFQVEAMGALKIYPAEKQKQTEKHKASAPAKKEVKVSVDIESWPSAKEGLEIMPGVFVKQVEMER